MAKATIKSKTGAVITIEGSEAEVSNILATYERATVVGQAKEVIAKVASEKKEQKKRAAASDLVVELKEDGFFEKPKGLGDIAKALEEKGYIYPVTTLSGVVLGLVQKKLLGRKRLEGRWVYGK
jgi:predicted transcriptional regulator YheO